MAFVSVTKPMSIDWVLLFLTVSLPTKGSRDKTCILDSFRRYPKDLKFLSIALELHVTDWSSPMWKSSNGYRSVCHGSFCGQEVSWWCPLSKHQGDSRLVWVPGMLGVELPVRRNPLSLTALSPSWNGHQSVGGEQFSCIACYIHSHTYTHI